MHQPTAHGYCRAPIPEEAKQGFSLESQQAAMHSLATRDALAWRKLHDEPVNQYAGYGFKWIASGGSRRRIPDKGERYIMGMIYELRQTGHTWEEIHRQFRKMRLRTKWGGEWTESRIRRAYQAEVGLRQQEEQGTTVAAEST
jgi:hypothetical protein